MSFLKDILDEICLLLETYKGRDKILRTLCYTTRLIGGLHNNKNVAKKFLYFSSHMSGTRATLRLLDDFPMLQYNLEYGLGREEPDKFMAQLGVLTNIIDQVYYPIEKMSWLAEHKLISGTDNSKWDTASSVCWVLSIYLTLMKTLRYIAVLQNHKRCVQQDKSVPLDKILKMQKYEILTSIRLAMDLVHAINTLPPGYLWSSKLKTWHVGLIGSLSSLLGIYQIYYKRKAVHKEPPTMNSEEKKIVHAEYVRAFTIFIQQSRQIVLMDETNFNLFFRWTRGRAQAGVRVVQHLPVSRLPHVYLTCVSTSAAGVVDIWNVEEDLLLQF